MNINKLINKLEAKLSTMQNPNQEAWWFLEKLTKLNKTELLRQKDFALTPSQKEQLDLWVKQRTQEKKPLQYILGSMPFCNLEILTEHPILIPRPETEFWTLWLIDQLEPLKETSLRILDLCCGSGCIALALANAFPKFEVIGTDINKAAINLSSKNKERNKITNANFVLSDIYKNVEGKFDIIVSNPPYVTEEEWKNLDDVVKKWESKLALVASDNGLSLYKKIIQDAHKYLEKNILLENRNIPTIVLEIGETQGKGVEVLLKQASFNSVQIHKDLAHKDRFISAKL